MGKRYIGDEEGVEEFQVTCRREDMRELDRHNKRDVAASRAANRRTALANTISETAREESKMETIERMPRSVAQ